MKVPSTSTSSSSNKWQTNWTKCCLCQRDKKEDLKSPPTSYTMQNDGYTNIANNVPLFHAINALPITLDPSRLDEGEGIEATLRKNNAKYHQSCRLMFSNTKLQRAQKRRMNDTTPEESSSRAKIPRRNPSAFECFLCEKSDKPSELRHAMTKQLNDKVTECALALSDGKLLAKLSGGDAVALELKYHPVCLASLYNRHRAHLNTINEDESDSNSPDKDVYPLAFSELVIYITETKNACVGKSTPTFKLAELTKMYDERLVQLGVKVPNTHRSRLKEQLLAHMPELESYTKGREVLFAFRKDVGHVLSQASDFSEAIVLSKATGILRNRMLNHKSKFDGNFHEGCIDDSIPPQLLQFVGMIEHGANIKSQLKFGASKTDLAMAQLLQYNCYSRYREGAAPQRHSKDRETPFPVYLGLSVFAKTRKRQLVEMLHDNGICISYDRVLQISAQLGDAVVAKYVEDGVVCPPALRKGLFTTSAVDNIDHNPTATTATTSFHGTSVSIFQHPSAENLGEVREPYIIREGKVRTVPELPDFYTDVRPAYFKRKTLFLLQPKPHTCLSQVLACRDHI